MLSSVRALLEGTIDYAGLFPPARLALEPAFRNYLRYRADPESWMLGRFVCPVSRLGDAAALVGEAVSGDRPLAIAALGQGGKTIQDLLFNVRADQKLIAAFNKVQPQQAVADVYETKLPEALPRERMTELLDLVEQPTVFVEAADGTLSEVAAALQGCGTRAGIKLRCGGLEPAAFPTVEQLAAALRSCRDADLPVKFTAGLHHPLRHRDAQLGVFMHGFLNLFVGGILLHARKVNEEQLREILADEDKSHFHFAATDMSWGEFRATAPEIGAGRKWLTSFGSCSFDEPRQMFGRRFRP